LSLLEKKLATMFKFFFGPNPSPGPERAFSHHRKPLFAILGLLLLTTLSGCLTGPPLPEVNLSEPGWTIRQGQAVWQTGRKSPEIAGELLLATRADGSTFVQFTKTPFPVATAQSTAAGWKIEFPPQNRHFAAPGKPSARIVWFQLANSVEGKPAAKGWTWRDAGANWELKNSSSGESLEGYFTQ
jgi:hypothetical protein